jgi:hypothetical protein
MTPTYRDPADHRRIRPSLIGGLMTEATTHLRHPRENQISEALCWLIDRSAVLAEATVRLFLDEARASEVIDAANGCMGASTRISLNALPGDLTGHNYFPDIWVAGAKRSFQLMIEVKVGAEAHDMRVPFESLARAFPHTSFPDADDQGVVSIVQDDAYRLAWSLVPLEADAARRFVGFLWRDDGESRAHSTTGLVPGVEQARDVTWLELRNRFAEEADRVEPEIRVILHDFLQALDLHVQRPGPAVPADEAARMLAFGRQLLLAAHGDPSWRPASNPRIGPFRSEKDYAGFHMVFRPEGMKVDIHVYSTHPDGHLALNNEPEPAVYLLCNRSRNYEANQRFVADWTFGSDRYGYPGFRLVLPFSQLGWAPGSETEVDAALPILTTWLRESLDNAQLS